MNHLFISDPATQEANNEENKLRTSSQILTLINKPIKNEFGKESIRKDSSNEKPISESKILSNITSSSLSESNMNYGCGHSDVDLISISHKKTENKRGEDSSPLDIRYLYWIKFIVKLTINISSDSQSALANFFYFKLFDKKLHRS